MKEQETVIVALCEGRHQMPTDQYIFPHEIDPMDFDSMNKTVGAFLEEHVGIRMHCQEALNQMYEEDVPCYAGERKLVVYVTGLSAALAAVIRGCALNGVSLTLMHYNRDTNDYAEQVIFA